MKRLLTAALFSVLLVAIPAAPALAMTNTRFVSPGSDAVKGTVTVQVASTPEPGLLGGENVSVTVTITPPSGAGGPITLNLSPKGGDLHEASWNTSSLPYNGNYGLEAVARSSSLLGEKSQRATATAKVANPPATPTGVKAVLKDGVPHVTWSANTEKDLLGYRLMRSADGGGPVEVSAGAATSFTDSGAPHSAALTYRVIAVRKSPVSASGVPSGTSAPSAAVTIPAPPPPPEPAAGEAPAGDGAPADSENPVVPGTNIVTGKETPAAPPVTNNSFGRAIAPIVKAAPGGTAFDETLPYDGIPPEQFEAAAGSDPSPLDAQGLGDGVTVTNPAKFVLGGILLLIASGFMWRTSRRLLKATKVPEGVPPAVNYPAFRINRG